MRQRFSLYSCKNLILFSVMSVFMMNHLIGQENDKDETAENQITVNFIAIDQISEETEKIGHRILNIQKILSPNMKISNVDSIFKIFILDVETRKDSVLLMAEGMNRRELSARKIEWNNYRSKLKEYQSLVSDRTEEIGEVNDELIIELNRWKDTKEELKKSASNVDIYNSLNEIISSIQEVILLAHDRLEIIFVLQKNLTKMVLTIDSMISEIERIERQIQKEYFVFDSPPIWKSQQLDSTATDSITHASRGIFNLDEGMAENKRQIKEFYYLNAKNAVLQVIFILLTLTLFLLVRRRWNVNLDEIKNPIERDAKIVLTKPIASTLVIGLLISVFFYDAIIPILGEIHLFLIFGATVLLLPKLTESRFQKVLFLLLIIFLIQFSNFYWQNPNYKRWAMVLEGVLLVFTLSLGIKIVRSGPENYGKIAKSFNTVIPFYVFVACISVISNIVGMVGLAEFLTKGILLSTMLGFIVFLAVKIVSSISILFFRLRKSYNLQTLTTMIEATNNRIQPVLYWTGFIVWIYFTLKAFDLHQVLVKWVDQMLTVDWIIGKMTISLGGILSFTGILIITLIIAKLIASIFQDDWMVKVLPRGIAPAISLILRIILVSIGLWVGLSAVGLDLSRLGFILGALGVGIGFGLQNVVLNFIAGLILAFERPINLGDTIEIDQEFGVVTNIGIRSSNIRTYSGSEAIIPNGDLISKKVINWTLKNRDRRSKIFLKTAPNANPKEAIALFNRIASEHTNTFDDPAPNTFFKGYGEDGNLQFELMYWTTFSDTLTTNHEIALNIFEALRLEGIEAPAPVRRIIKEK